MKSTKAKLQGNEAAEGGIAKPERAEATVSIPQSIWEAAKGLEADLSSVRQELERTQSDLDQVREELSLSRAEHELVAAENQALKLKLGQALDVITRLQAQHHEQTHQRRVVSSPATQWIEALRAPR